MAVNKISTAIAATPIATLLAQSFTLFFYLNRYDIFKKVLRYSIASVRSVLQDLAHSNEPWHQNQKCNARR